MNRISFAVANKEGELVYFQAKYDAKMEKVLQSYKEKKGIRDCVLSRNGREIDGEDTPLSLRMSQGEYLLAFTETPVADLTNHINICVLWYGKKLHFAVSERCKVSTIIRAVEQNSGMCGLILQIKGKIVDNNETIASLQVQEGELIIASRY